jgi:nucleoporin POM152
MYRSVTMNPDQFSFCIGDGHPSVTIPLRFNQSRPQHVQLLRIDFETNVNETITLTKKEMRHPSPTEDGMTTVNYVTKKPGLYRLQKVMDRTKLEVQRRMSDTLVLACPKGRIKSSAPNKCIGDLSDLTMEIEGTPPLKVVYSRTANAEMSVHHFQSIQPESFESPLLGNTRSGTLVVAGNKDVFWGRTQKIVVPLNESMVPSGRWLYSINEIHDAVGNVANFSSGADDGEHHYPKGAHLEQHFMVHDRPIARLVNCDSRNPLKVPSGRVTQLPVQYATPGRTPDDTSHTLTWKFSALDSLTKNGDHGDYFVEESYLAKNSQHTPSIRLPGLYTLTGVKSQFCEGEIQEPASCLLLNPPEPQLSIAFENINDKCAGKPIGLLVDLDLIGTPPFVVRYDVITKSGTRSETVNVKGARQQLELKPRNAGKYQYRFTSIDDSVYKAHVLSGNEFVLEQDVKPPASATLRKTPENFEACIEEPVELHVELLGEPPFLLEYELIHNGKRERFKLPNIETDFFTIKTNPLLAGGEYSLALTSIQDTTGCKIFLDSNVKFNVRRQRPKVQFGQIEGKFKTIGIEGRPVTMPLRLTGSPPFIVSYHNYEFPDKIFTRTARAANDFIKVDQQGKYEILDVFDNQCPGTVDPQASTFEIDWVARPQIKVADTAVLQPVGEKWVKREVCEGDIDGVDVHLLGKHTLSDLIQIY